MGLRIVLVASVVGGTLFGVCTFGAGEEGIGEVIGEILVKEGSLPEGSKVRATPVLGGNPHAVAITDGAHFVFGRLPEGRYRFEIVLANNSVFAEAGTVETSIRSGTNRLTLVVSRGRVPPETRPFADWRKGYRVWTVVGGVVAATLICEEADCFEDDDNVASPAAP